VTVKQAIVLCAGKGTRLGKITETVPKPLVPVVDTPFVYFAIRNLLSAGIEDVVLLVSYLKEKFEDVPADFTSGKVRLSNALPSFNKGILAVSNLQSLFFVLNGDCLPLMSTEEWNRLPSLEDPCVFVKKRKGNILDVGLVLVTSESLSRGLIDCSNMYASLARLRHYQVDGGFHIGTLIGLEMARKDRRYLVGA